MHEFEVTLVFTSAESLATGVEALKASAPPDGVAWEFDEDLGFGVKPPGWVQSLVISLALNTAGDLVADWLLSAFKAHPGSDVTIVINGGSDRKISISLPDANRRIELQIEEIRGGPAGARPSPRKQ